MEERRPEEARRNSRLIRRAHIPERRRETATMACQAHRMIRTRRPFGIGPRRPPAGACSDRGARRDHRRRGRPERPASDHHALRGRPAGAGAGDAEPPPGDRTRRRHRGAAAPDAGAGRAAGRLVRRSRRSDRIFETALRRRGRPRNPGGSGGDPRERLRSRRPRHRGRALRLALVRPVSARTRLPRHSLWSFSPW